MVKKGKTAGNTEKCTICSFNLEKISKDKLIRDSLLVAIISIVSAVVLLPLLVNISGTFLDMFDIGYYFNQSVKMMIYSQIPYVDFAIDYPQFALLYFNLPMLFALLFNDANVYVIVHQFIMIVAYMLTSIMVYFIALKYYSPNKALISGLLCATALSSVYFVLTKYDALPTFFLILSIFLYVYGKEKLSFCSSGIGFLVKWFPIFSIPYFAINEHKSGYKLNKIIVNLLIPLILILVVTAPFIMNDWNMFFATYTMNLNWNVLAHGFPFYVDNILYNLTGITGFANISTYLMLCLEFLLLGLYYAINSKKTDVMIYFIFVSVFIFVLFNKISSPQYLLWYTPFMALFLADNYKEVILFYVIQIWSFLEFPLLFRSIYVNDIYPHYLAVSENFLNAGFLFFTVKFILLLTMIWLISAKMEIPKHIIDALSKVKSGTGN